MAWNARLAQPENQSTLSDSQNKGGYYMEDFTFNGAHLLITVAALAIGYCFGYAHGYLTREAVK